MGGDTPKQFQMLAGVPMLLRSLRPFTSHPEVNHTVVVLPRAQTESPPEWLSPLLTGSLSVVAGGTERSDSAAAGLAALPPNCRVVLVHDGARPFVARPVIDTVIGRAREGFGAVAAVPLGDTLKEATPSQGRIIVRRTVPRGGLWRAQTPQAFPRDLLEAAYARAAQDGYHGTDDAELVERCGGQVELIEDSSENLKITTPRDFDWAQLLAMRQR